MILRSYVRPYASLQITFSYKPVICQARDKVWPDMQPVWSDITFVFLKWKYIFLFRVITEEPSQHVRSDSVFASQNPQIGRTNVRCPALICRPVMGIEMLFHGIQASNVRGFSMYERLTVYISTQSDNWKIKVG